MNETMYNIFVFIAGIAIGILFFGGLWWTTRKALTSKKPAILFAISFVVRLGITILLFYALSGGHWEELLVCFGGFLLGRVIITVATRTKKKNVKPYEVKS
ncbi:ATP synthase subunit I [Chitinophaga silvatica]|uniref:ATP synthase subunit I n=1 Tax=Chitinophaga silvatica TaxID=2282649 RepID=A0A3E1Y622_9BACT|nr:ATP synthase subunit I [Chitinophaga silvatica]RFS20183.1 ATP synthase subunit I [Chitinophaga silvatica]